MLEETRVDVRDARAEDVEAIAGFNEAMARETEDVRLDAATIRAGVKAVLDDPGKGRYFVAEIAGEVAGCVLITYEWSDWRNAMIVWLQSVYVTPAHRLKGVFRALFRHAEAIARSPGHCGMRLYVDSHNATAQKTYAKLGMAFRGYLVFETRDALREG